MYIENTKIILLQLFYHKALKLYNVLFLTQAFKANRTKTVLKQSKAKTKEKKKKNIVSTLNLKQKP